MLVTVVSVVTLVTDGVTECLGEKVKLRKLRKLHKLRPNFFRRRLVSYGSYGSYASYGWCQRIFVRKCQVTEVTEVTQVTGQFFSRRTQDGYDSYQSYMSYASYGSEFWSKGQVTELR